MTALKLSLKTLLMTIICWNLISNKISWMWVGVRSYPTIQVSKSLWYHCLSATSIAKYITYKQSKRIESDYEQLFHVLPYNILTEMAQRAVAVGAEWKWDWRVFNLDVKRLACGQLGAANASVKVVTGEGLSVTTCNCKCWKISCKNKLNFIAILNDDILSVAALIAVLNVRATGFGDL